MKKILFSIFALLICSFAMAQTVEQTYHFGRPVINTVEGYQQISFANCRQSATTGQPTLPWQSVSLMLPQNQKAVSIELIYDDFVELDGSYSLFPQQEPRTLSSTKPFVFAKDEDTYRSQDVYPSLTHGKVSTQYLNGMGFAFSSFTPVRYIPAIGKVSYAQTVTVKIHTQASRDDHRRMLWLTSENRAIAQRLAQNGEMLNTYQSRGREENNYDILVITPEEWVNDFEDYIFFHKQRGYEVQVASLEDICANMEGCDEQEKMRNYIIQEYENNGISYIMLGGDVDIVPFRYLWCYVGDDCQDQLPADMYFACLDGTMNDDGDDKWGEVDEVDLVPEIAVARLPFNDKEQFETLMHKIFSYSDTPVVGEFRTLVLGGEHLGDGYYGGVGLDRLIGMSNYYDYTTYGYPEDYNVVRVYASETHEWSGDELRDAMGQGGQYVYHDGHAGTDYVAGWYNTTVTPEYFGNNNGLDHNFLPFHTHGCDCGNYPEDCIVERLVTNPTGCVVSAGNSRYGWYIPFGDGPSDHLCRELVDGYWNDGIQQFGMAYRESKIMTAPWVETGWGGEEYSSLRWNFYDLNTFGDPAISLWFGEPFHPEVHFLSGLSIGTSSTTVTVTDSEGQPLQNFFVSLFNGEERISTAHTDETGSAVLLFEPFTETGNLILRVSGRNAYSHSFNITVFDNTEPYIDITNVNFNGLLEFGQTITLDVTMENLGGQSAFGLTTTLFSESSHIEIIDGQLNGVNLDPSQSQDFGQAFILQISDNTPDLQHCLLRATTTDGVHEWNRWISIDVNAPKLRFESISFDDSLGNGDGIIDVGEPIVLHVTGRNAGHATAPNTYLRGVCYPVQVIIPNQDIMIGDVEAGNEFSVDLPFTTDENTIQGSIYDMHLSLISGRYNAQETFMFSAGRPTEDFESGDFSMMDWNFEGELPWVVTSDSPHAGQYCAKSGDIEKHQYSRMYVETEIREDGMMSFFYKFSTKPVRDYFRFYIDGRLATYGSGEQDWIQFSTDITAGEHTFIWSYERGINDNEGANSVWIDDIVFPANSVILDVEGNVGETQNTLYPNPSQGQFTLVLAYDDNNITIYNTIGQAVIQRNKVSGTQQINLPEKGLYFVQIKNENKVEVMKIIIE